MKKIITLLFVLSFLFNVKSQTTLTTAVDFTVTDLNGNSFNLFNTLNSNKYVFIDFFFTTCVPCQQNTPKVQYAFQHFGCNTSNVFFISIDNGDNNAACASFETTYQSLSGAKFPSASGLEGGANAVVSAYGIPAFPTCILIAPNKAIVEQDIWPINDGASLTTLIQGHGGTLATCAVGVDELSSNPRTGFVNAFPVPSQGNYTLQFNAESNQEIGFEVYNLMGEKVISIPAVEYTVGLCSYTMNANELASGTYFVHLMSKGVNQDVRKMVILK